MLLVLAVAGKAQENVPFEGEIVYETYENYSNWYFRHGTGERTWQL